MSEGALAEARRRVAAARRVVALTGAGVSTESGIPDVRGPNGAALPAIVGELSPVPRRC